MPAELVVAARRCAIRRNRRSCIRTGPAGRRYRNRTIPRWWSSRACQAGLLGDVGESPVAVVAIENAAAVRGDEHVRPAVVVVVANRTPMPKVAAAATPAFSVTSVNVPSRLFLYSALRRGLCRGIEIAWAAVHQVNVHPAVVVVIQESAAGAEAFGQITLRRHGVLVYPGDTTGPGRYFLEDGAVHLRNRRGAQLPAAADPPQRGACSQKPSTRKSTWHFLVPRSR